MLFRVTIFYSEMFSFVYYYSNFKFFNGQNNKLAFSTGGAVNVNNFDWSIAGNLQGRSPNILSELIFKDIKSLVFRGYIQALEMLELNTFYQGNGVLSGKGTDTDYGSDNQRITSLF